jgi:hypothetical protein
MESLNYKSRRLNKIEKELIIHIEYLKSKSCDCEQYLEALKRFKDWRSAQQAYKDKRIDQYDIHNIANVFLCELREISDSISFLKWFAKSGNI